MWSGDFVGSPLISEYIQNIIKHESLKCLKVEKLKANRGMKEELFALWLTPLMAYAEIKTHT